MQPVSSDPVVAPVQNCVPIDPIRAVAKCPAYFAVVILTRGEGGQQDACVQPGPASVILGPFSAASTARFIHVSALALGLTDGASIARPN